MRGPNGNPLLTSSPALKKNNRYIERAPEWEESCLSSYRLPVGGPAYRVSPRHYKISKASNDLSLF